VVQRRRWAVRDHDPAEILEATEARTGSETQTGAGTHAEFLAVQRSTEPQSTRMKELIITMTDRSVCRLRLDNVVHDIRETVTR
jgi:hypothetical protein